MPNPDDARGQAQPCARPRLALWGLMLGNLVIGTGFLLPAGMLHLMAKSLSVSVPQAGALMWAGGATLAIGAPLMAWLASTADRRRLLIASLLLYVVGNALSAMATEFGTLLALRLITLVGAAIYTPQAATCVGLLLPPQQRAAGVTFVFLGWAVASALGMPLGGWVGAYAGWATPFWVVSLSSAAVLALLAFALPAGMRAPPVSSSTWIAVVRDRQLPSILAVTMVQMSGQFVVFTYLAPEIDRRLGAGPSLLALLLAWYGIFGFAGNLAASRTVTRFGASRLVLAGLGLTASGLLCLALAPPLPASYFASFLIWGLGGFAVQSLQAARLIATRPELAPATVSLNSAALYVGQATGGLAGAALIAAGRPDGLPWVGLVMVVAAIGVSLLADRRAPGTR